MSVAHPQQKGRRMRPKLTWVALPGLIAVLAFALSACGGGGGTNTTAAQQQFAPPTAPPDNAQKGGDLTVLAAGDVDYMDPGAAYYQFTYMITSATQRPLLSWQPDDVAQPTPDLADSPPDSKEVTSADVKYAIERGLMPGVANGYEAAYLGSIHGFAQAQAAVKQNPTQAPDISGIETPDKYTLVFKLDK